MIYLFNPDTDLALATDRAYYTAPAKVVAMTRRLALLPAIYATEGDAILLPDGVTVAETAYLPYAEIAAQKGLRLITAEMLAESGSEPICPWGWNRSVVTWLKNYGVRPEMLPSDQEIDSVRSLSHRLTSLRFNQMLEGYGLNCPNEPNLIHTLDDAFQCISRLGGDCYIKTPWSSSGRGVFATKGLSAEVIGELAGGIIGRQGAVMIERNVGAGRNYATEWMMADGKAEYCGLSSFITNGRNAYIANVRPSDDELAVLQQYGLDRVIEAQLCALEQTIGESYSGQLGIDMLLTDKFGLTPCLEINLRMTMGHVALSYFAANPSASKFSPGK